MDPLKSLMESKILDDETKAIIREAFDAAVQEKTSELKEQFESENGEVSADVLAMIEESVNNELEPLREEIEHARTLDVKYADKFETFKEEYHENQEARMNEEISRLVSEEIDELREDINEAKKNEFGRKLYEDYREYFTNSFGEDGANANDLKSKLDEATSELEDLRREKKINELLEGVTGRTRNVARTILEGTTLDNMDKRFESVKSLLISEDTDSAEGADTTITEGADTTGKNTTPKDGDTLVVESEENKGNTQPNRLVERSIRARRAQ